MEHGESSHSVQQAIDERTAGTGFTEAQSAQTEELVRRYHRSVRLFIARQLADQHMVDDIAQDVFLTALAQYKAYRGEGAVQSWLFGIARNKVLDYLRGRARRLRREGQQLDAALADWRVSHMDTDPFAVAEERRIQEVMTDCVGDLPNSSKQLINGFYFEGRTAQALAEEQGKSPGAVRMTLMRARAWLRDCITHRMTSRAE